MAAKKKEKEYRISLFSFRVPGPVVPQARPRATTICGHVAMHDTDKCRSYKMDVAACAQAEITRRGLQVPVIPSPSGFYVSIRISKAYLKSMSGVKRELASEGRIRPTSKPDLDNAAKGILDAMKGVFWADDSAVTELNVEKLYSDMDYTDVSIKWLEEVEK